MPPQTAPDASRLLRQHVESWLAAGISHIPGGNFLSPVAQLAPPDQSPTQIVRPAPMNKSAVPGPSTDLPRSATRVAASTTLFAESAQPPTSAGSSRAPAAPLAR